MDAEENREEKREGNRLMKGVQDIFMPLIPMLMATAILKGILLLLVNLGALQEKSGLYQLLYGAASAFFYFLPVFVAYTSSKVFHASSLTAVTIACTMLYPDLTAWMESGDSLTVAGLPLLEANYESGIIPVVLSVALLHFVELPLEKWLPRAVKHFMKPLLSLVILVPLVFLIAGPLGTWIGSSLAQVFLAIYKANPGLAGAFLGFFMQPMVSIGAHWALTPVIVENIARYGYDTIQPLMGGAVMAQCGAALATGLIVKKPDQKHLAFSGSFAAFLGVTEPALFGTNLVLGFPFLCGCIGGAAGGALAGVSGSRALAVASPSFLTALVYWGQGFWAFILSMCLGFVIGFVLTMAGRHVVLRKAEALKMEKEGIADGKETTVGA